MHTNQPYCFKAMCFRKLFSEIHVLRQVFRQKDQSFVDVWSCICTANVLR